MTQIAFGTDGWRGIIARDFTFDNVALVAAAIADYIEEEGIGGKGVVIGYDFRFLSRDFAHTIAGVLADRGIPVYIGDRPMPTPATAFAVRHFKTAGAVMLTASHNPPEYNGIKFIPSYAGPALPHITREIEHHIARRLKERDGKGGNPAQTANKTAPREEIDIREEYFKHLKTLIDGEAFRRTGMHVVVDALYGCGQDYLDRLLRELGAEVEVLHNYCDPLFGGSLPDPSAEKLAPLREAVLEKGAHLGLGLDGDADRLGIIDTDGTYISPNQLLALVYYHLLEVRGWNGPAARTVATTHMVDRIGRAYGQQVLETPVGFKYIGQALMEKGCIAGGEESGGLSIKGHVPEKDGILAGLLAVEIAALSGRSLGQLWSELEERLGRLVSRRIDVRTSPGVKKRVLESLRDYAPESLAGKKVTDRMTVDGTKLLLDDGSWVLVRASGTEPVFRIYAESTSEQEVRAIQEEVKKQVGL